MGGGPLCVLQHRLRVGATLRRLMLVSKPADLSSAAHGEHEDSRAGELSDAAAGLASDGPDSCASCACGSILFVAGIAAATPLLKVLFRPRRHHHATLSRGGISLFPR